ncbi:Trp repressor/replication initiator [Gracilaria domingensis]|nr:Trp repressor/replication initiator [Gracilaria domingensis]
MSATFTAPIPTSPSVLPSTPTTAVPPKSDPGNLKSSDAEVLKSTLLKVDSDALRDHDSPAHAAAIPAPVALPSAPDQSNSTIVPSVVAPPSAPDQSNSTIAPSVVPAIPPSASMDLMPDTTVTPVNLRPRSKNRPGRPPNINENSLMRRLECIMAVDTGRMTMSEACQHFDISARTFYRWLRNKERLIELTGFTEDDFKHGPPPAERVALSDQIHRMPPATVVDLHSNLPRLPQQPPIAAQSPSTTATGQTVVVAQRMALKRRMPRIPHYSNGYNDKGLMQSQIYHRNTTKMPAQNTAAADESPKACNSQSFTRKKWGPPGNDMDVRDANPLYNMPDSDEVAIAPNLESSKRRKVSRSDSAILDDAVDEVLEEHPNQSFVGKCANQGTTNMNGSIPNEQPQPQSSPEATQTKAATYPDTTATVQNGVADTHHRRLDLSNSQNLIQYVECSQKHKIEIVLGQKRVSLAWYHGATSADIKEAIVRRFSLVPGTQWALVDKFSDEIIVSEGMPSGRYQLTVLP